MREFYTYRPAAMSLAERAALILFVLRLPPPRRGGGAGGGATAREAPGMIHERIKCSADDLRKLAPAVRKKRKRA
jgi:hypothetical protein